MDEDLKKCSMCKIEKMKTDFYFRNTNQKYRSECMQCCSIKQKEWTDKNHEKLKNLQIQYYEDNGEKIRNQKKKYYDEIRDVINKNHINYERNRRKTDVNFRLICNTRRRKHHVLSGESKSSSTIEFLGFDIETYRRWIEWQMTPEMSWSNIEIDHVKAICLFDISKDEELKKAFNSKNTQPLLKHDHQKKSTKFNFLDYQLQFIEAFQFVKLNEKRPNEDIHQ